MAQEVKLNMDVDNQIKVSDYSFPHNEECVYLFRLLKNNYAFDMADFDSLTIVFKDNNNPLKIFTVTSSANDIITINGEQLVKVLLPTSLTSVDTIYTATPSIKINSLTKQLQSFMLMIYAQTSSEMIYVRQVITQFNNALGLYSSLIKKDKIGIAGGIVPTDSNNKIPDSFLPSAYRQHIDSLVRNSMPHGVGLNAEGQLIYLDPADNEIKLVKNQEDDPPSFVIQDGVVTVTLDPDSLVKEQRWYEGVEEKAFFRTGGGTLFTGNTFNVHTAGDYTFYYKKVSNKNYVFYFTVTEDQLAYYEPNIIVFDGLMDVEYTSPIATQEAKIASGIQDIVYFETQGELIVNNQHPITAIGEYTLYWMQENGRKFVTTFNVTEEQLIVHTPPIISLDGLDVTVTYTPEVEALVTEKKYDTGQRDSTWFIDHGTALDSNTFTLTQGGNTTYYYKYRNRGYVVEFYVEDYSYLVPLSDIPMNQEFVFGGRVWTKVGTLGSDFIVNDETPFIIDTTYGSSANISLTTNGNIGKTLQDYYLALPYRSDELASMVNGVWSFGTDANQESGSFSAKVGLSTKNEALDRSTAMRAKGLTGEYWTSTSSSSYYVFAINLTTNTTTTYSTSSSTKGMRGRLRLLPTTKVEKVPTIEIVDGVVTITD